MIFTLLNLGQLLALQGIVLIEETVREKLPNDFQTAEYLMDHGMVDMVTPRSEQPETIGRILNMLMDQPAKAAE